MLLSRILRQNIYADIQMWHCGCLWQFKVATVKVQAVYTGEADIGATGLVSSSNWATSPNLCLQGCHTYFFSSLEKYFHTWWPTHSSNYCILLSHSSLHWVGQCSISALLLLCSLWGWLVVQVQLCLVCKISSKALFVDMSTYQWSLCCWACYSSGLWASSWGQLQ